MFLPQFVDLSDEFYFFADDDAEWKCTHCEFKTKGEAVLRVFRVIQREIDELGLHAEEDPVRIEFIYLYKLP